MEIINKDETLDDLEIENIKIIQKKDAFRFGVDAVLLANFAKVQKNSRVMDLCTGTGIIPFIIAGKTKSLDINGMEIQEEFVQMAKRSVALNSLEKRMNFFHMDLKNLEYLKILKKFDVVTVNPPYKEVKTGIKNPNEKQAIARTEIMCTLEDVLISAKTLLTDNGRFYMVHRPDRLVDIFSLMRKYKIEPKRVQMIHPNLEKAPNIVLIEGQNFGGKFLKWEEPLFVRNLDGSYTKDLERIYGRE